MPDSLDDFTSTTVTYDGVTKTVYRQGSGPAVIVLAEMPGITPEVADFARRIQSLGCTAVMPSLFGTDGAELSQGRAVVTMLKACVSKEFHGFATGKTSPVIDWLRQLARDVHAELGGPGVGVIGMCFTGGFALGMMVDDTVVAPVLSQPSLPLPLTKKAKGDLGLSPGDLRVVKERVAEGCPVLGMRFTHDGFVHADRFAELRAQLGEGFIGIEIDSSPNNPHGIPKAAHSVVTNDLVDEPGHPTRDALDAVLDFFTERLGTTRS